MKKSNTTRKSESPKRYRIARSDASIESILKSIERDFGLPTGSVKLVYPSGRKARADATVGSLLKQWEPPR